MEASPAGARDLDVVVLGASGIAGRNVAAYLTERAGEVDARWAVAGRDAAKVERVLAEVGVTAPETIVADVGDPGSLAAMAARTKVVLDLVGPYTLYGTPVIEACIANGAHYVDLTGEMPFARRTIDAFDGRAAAASVKVVQVCGFEALPPDLAVLLAAETAQERWGEALAAVDVDVLFQPPPGRLRLADSVSGGTLQSGAEQMDDPEAERVADPAALIPDAELAERVRRASPIAIAPRFNAQGDVIGPMTPSAFVNPAVIHRTMALTASRRGAAPEPFRYREGAAMPDGIPTTPLRYAAATALSGLQAGFGALSRARPAVRHHAAAAMRRFMPQSGFGPAGAALEDWKWSLAVTARTANGHHVRVDLDADGQPGYLTTSRMLGEAGLLLAEDGATLPGGGCLTPAAALGTDGIDRFARAGLRFRVSS
ncbi:MAG TPA: saccharopine dehydrogenase NADP-binding domain-containing protein [Solirubrobacterales bacterium]|nr:saccharopine dehydrogenase NADP-binding domain-containing protein [Solirubrobacterales bacterium]